MQRSPCKGVRTGGTFGALGCMGGSCVRLLCGAVERVSSVIKFLMVTHARANGCEQIQV